MIWILLRFAFSALGLFFAWLLINDPYGVKWFAVFAVSTAVFFNTLYAFHLIHIRRNTK